MKPGLFKNKPDTYAGHLERCERCARRPFDLCKEGAAARFREDERREREGIPHVTRNTRRAVA